MKVIATLDYWDGRKSITKIVDIERVAASGQLLLMLQGSGVASVTLTRLEKLDRIADHLKESEQ